MFIYTLGFKKQGCRSIIEDCFVSQQHLMEEAPEKPQITGKIRVISPTKQTPKSPKETNKW
jgi:hypothetical protein